MLSLVHDTRYSLSYTSKYFCLLKDEVDVIAKEMSTGKVYASVLIFPPHLLPYVQSHRCFAVVNYVADRC